jgi:hypothetical protein
MSIQANVFNDSLQFYTADSEAVRSAAAFATGEFWDYDLLQKTNAQTRQYLYWELARVSSHHC